MADEKNQSIFEAMMFLKNCFDEHAKKEGEKATLTKKELADMLRQQFDIVSENINNIVLPESCECFINRNFFSLLLY